MPDWSYRTLFRPLLFRMPVARARDLCLGVLGAVGRSPAGPGAIDFLGHMRADPRLGRTVMGMYFPSPVGLGAGMDVESRATPAFARFGFGFLEVGPVTREAIDGSGEIVRDDRDRSFTFPVLMPNPGVEALARRLQTLRPDRPPVWARLGVEAGAGPARALDDYRSMVAQLAPFVDAFVVDPPRREWGTDRRRAVVEGVVEAAHPKPVVLRVDALGAEEPLIRGVAGLLADGGSRVLGRPAHGASLAMVGRLRERHGPDLRIVAAGGIHEPADALAFFEAGADLVQIDSGLAFGGPGLPKRTNEALLSSSTPHPPDTARAAERPWLWSLLMGLGMLLGGVMAVAIAVSRVVLPYDEGFVGLGRDQLKSINPRLLPFMAHDRVSLAGAMVAVGVLYSGLAWWGIRSGMHWAWKSVTLSASLGFASFFLFLGFGYFDPFHAFVTSILCQFLLLSIFAKPGPAPLPDWADLRGDRAWRRSLWGQLALVAQAVGLMGAGATIAYVGVTTVFVPEDLHFLQTTAAELSASTPRLVPLVAHDRAAFGAMLACVGLTYLTSTLWGFARGRRWLWWTMLAAGAPGYLAAIAVHRVVGYEDAWHLAPTFAGLGLLLVGLGLSGPYLLGRNHRRNGLL